jgi:hypothetical protein
MRVMILAKSTPETESAERNAEGQGFEAMGRFTKELVDAGILLASDALQPSAKGARVRFEGKRRTVIDGPFMEAKELVAGFWIWRRSMRRSIGSSERHSATARSWRFARSWMRRGSRPSGRDLTPPRAARRSPSDHGQGKRASVLSRWSTAHSDPAPTTTPDDSGPRR